MRKKTYGVAASSVMLGVLVVGMATYLWSTVSAPDKEIVSLESSSSSQETSPVTSEHGRLNSVNSTRNSLPISTETATDDDDSFETGPEGFKENVAPEMSPGNQVASTEKSMRSDDGVALKDSRPENGRLNPAENIDPDASRRFFVKGQDYTVQDLPEGKLKAKLLTLNPESRSRAIDRSDKMVSSVKGSHD